jgi:uncharacterized protein (DUF488 family)
LFFARKAEQIDDAEYERQYKEQILDKLDPKEIYNALQGSVLLCWEPVGQFCHRRIVSQWIFDNLGIEVPEWIPGDDDIPETKAKPLF